MSLKIKIKGSDNISDIEDALLLFEKDNPKLAAEIWLARNLSSSYFLESSIGGLIATIARRVEKLTIRDWHDRWSDPEITKHFCASLVGYTAVVFATTIENARKEPLPKSLPDLRMSGDQVGGLIERYLTAEDPSLARGDGSEHQSLGKQLTLVAYDHNGTRSTPFLFSGLMHHREQFIKTFQDLKRKYLEVGETPKFLNFRQKIAEVALASFVFEAFQNSYEHGCLGSEGEIVDGLRSLRLVRHSANRPRDLLTRAAGFPELEEFISLKIVHSSYEKLMEVCVSDHGLGIVDFYRQQTRQAGGAEISEVELLKRIVLEPLTSKLGRDGAGYGFKIITEAIQQLGGFMVIRTGSTRLCYSPAQEGPYRFQEKKLGAVVGTTISFLYPLMGE